MKTYTFRTIIEPDGKKFHGFVPSLTGCHTFGRTIKETKKNLREAIELYVESLLELGEKVPEEKSLETFETIAISPTRVHA